MMGERMQGVENLPSATYVGNVDDHRDMVPTFQTLTLKEGELVIKKESNASTLFFILSGRLKTTPMSLWPAERELAGRCLFLIPDSDSFYGKAMDTTVLCCCTFRRCLLRLAEMPQSPSDPSSDTRETTGLCPLPLSPALQCEVESLFQTPPILLHDPEYACHKGRVLTLLMRQLYGPEATARLLAPILHRDPDFRELVLMNYMDTNRVKDLSKRLHIPATTFNRKFREAFGMSAKEWFIRKREEHLLHDILLTDLSLNEIADKYELTPNHLMKVCKDTFHRTFTELRASHTRQDVQARPL